MNFKFYWTYGNDGVDDDEGVAFELFKEFLDKKKAFKKSDFICAQPNQKE